MQNQCPYCIRDAFATPKDLARHCELRHPEEWAARAVSSPFPSPAGSTDGLASSDGGSPAGSNTDTETLVPSDRKATAQPNAETASPTLTATIATPVSEAVSKSKKPIQSKADSAKARKAKKDERLMEELVQTGRGTGSHSESSTGNGRAIKRRDLFEEHKKDTVESAAFSIPPDKVVVRLDFGGSGDLAAAVPPLSAKFASPPHMVREMAAFFVALGVIFSEDGRQFGCRVCNPPFMNTTVFKSTNLKPALLAQIKIHVFGRKTARNAEDNRTTDVNPVNQLYYEYFFDGDSASEHRATFTSGGRFQRVRILQGIFDSAPQSTKSASAPSEPPAASASTASAAAESKGNRHTYCHHIKNCIVSSFNFAEINSISTAPMPGADATAIEIVGDAEPADEITVWQHAMIRCSLALGAPLRNFDSRFQSLVNPTRPPLTQATARTRLPEVIVAVNNDYAADVFADSVVPIFTFAHDKATVNGRDYLCILVFFLRRDAKGVLRHSVNVAGLLELKRFAFFSFLYWNQL